MSGGSDAVASRDGGPTGDAGDAVPGWDAGNATPRQDGAGEAAPIATNCSGAAASAVLAITEVLANPAGSEGLQEFVEIRNLGAGPASLGGLAIEDGAGGDPLPGFVLAPGGFALVVPGSYKPFDGRDPPPRPGTTVVKVEGRIGADGLDARGEPVTLRDQAGRVVSRYGGWVDMSASTWNGKSTHRVARAEACDGPPYWTVRPLPPTPGW
jgi:hypothetical protein